MTHFKFREMKTTARNENYRNRRNALPGTILGPLAVTRPVPYVTCEGVAFDETMLICSRSADWPW